MDDEKYIVRIDEPDFSLIFRITDPFLKQAYDDNQPVFIETIKNYLRDGIVELNLFDNPKLQERFKVMQRDAKKMRLELLLKKDKRLN